MLKALIRRHLLLWVAMTGLLGCATPRYETTTLREVPVAGSAQACLQGCEARLDTCKQTCSENYQACLKRVEPELDEHYRQTLDRYAAELELYRRDMVIYDMHLWLNWNWDHGSFWYDPWRWPYPYYTQPPPRPPSREADGKLFREEQCGGDCGCQLPYDACFLACGGKITSQQRCVSNCPAER